MINRYILPLKIAFSRLMAAAVFNRWLSAAAPVDAKWSAAAQIGGFILWPRDVIILQNLSTLTNRLIEKPWYNQGIIIQVGHSEQLNAIYSQKCHMLSNYLLTIAHFQHLKYDCFLFSSMYIIRNYKYY